MSKVSRRKQLKPQHLLNDGEEGDDNSTNHTKNDGKPETPRTKMDRANNNMETITPDTSDNDLDSDVPASASKQSRLLIDEKIETDDNAIVPSSQLSENPGLSNRKSELDDSSSSRMQLRENAGFRAGRQLTPIREYKTRHRVSHLEDRTCAYCNAVKKSPADLERHLRKHTGERPFPCQLCSKAFKAKRSLQYHQYMHHGVEQKDSNISQRYEGIRKRKLEMEKLRSEIIENTIITDNQKEVVAADFLIKKVKVEEEEEEEETNPVKIECVDSTESVSLDTNEEKINETDLKENFSENLCAVYTEKDASEIVTCSNDVRSDTEDNPHIQLDTVTDKSVVNCQTTAIGTSTIDQTQHNYESRNTISDGNVGKLNTTSETGCDITEFDCTNGQVGQRVCQICGKICLKPSDLKRHLMVHTGERPFKCHVCGKPFKAKNSMLYHQKAAHGMDIELSPGLEERFLRLKYRSHKNFLLYQDHLLPQNDAQGLGMNGRVDDFDFDDADSKSTDSSFTHNMCGGADNLESLGNSGQTLEEMGDSVELDCPVQIKNEFDVGSVPLEETYEQGIDKCVTVTDDMTRSLIGSVISTVAPFTKNKISIKNETVIVSRLDGVDIVSGEDVSLYKCYLCGKVFNFLSKLQCHLSLHFDREIVSYECLYCDATFQFKTQMLNHVRRRHGKEKTAVSDFSQPTPISDSSSQLSQSSESLDCAEQEQHLQEDSEVQRHKQAVGFRKLNGSYVCVYCRKTFKYILALQHHMQIHRAVKSMYCKECGKGFTEYKSLRNHILHIHRNMDFSSPNSEFSKFSLRCRLRNKALSKQGETGNTDDCNNLEKARELLEHEGLEEGVMVVMPAEPPGESPIGQSDDQCSNTSDNDWSDTGSDGEQMEESPSSEIMSAPKRSLLSFRKEGKQRRKSALPVRIDNSLHVSSTPTLEALIKEEKPDISVKSHSIVKSAVVLPSSAALAMPTVNSMLLSNLRTIVSGTQGSILVPASSVISAASQVIGLPITVQVPGENQGRLKTPSPSLSSKSDPSPSDRENLVGYPRVQWAPGECPTSPSFQWHNYLDGRTGISSDGRKVTSLSRTHSRLPIVSVPVNRDQICKPTALNDGRTVYRCPFCSKDFLSYSDINRHMDFHEDIRPYKCKFCDYYARTNSQLKVHMLRHQGIREFCCKLCNYKGVTQSDLNRHMKSQIHLLKSRNECDKCGEGFVTSKNLEKHQMGNCSEKLQNCTDLASWDEHSASAANMDASDS